MNIKHSTIATQLLTRIFILSCMVGIGIITASISSRFFNVFLFACIFSSSTVALLGFLPLIRQVSGALLRLGLSIREYLYITIIGFLVVLGFLVSVPLNVDRSFTVWTLNQIVKIDTTSDGLSLESLKTRMATFFSEESSELNRRIEEQILIGNLTMDSKGIVSLTDKGRQTRETFLHISKFFGLNPVYSQ